MYFPSFAFDLLAALFVLLAVHELWRDRLLSAWVLLCLAVFTKETALFAPVCASLAVWWPGAEQPGAVRRAVRCLNLLSPVLLWLLLRHAAFHGTAQAYLLQGLSLHNEAANVLHGFLSWPFGTRTVGQPASFRLLYFPLNACFWLFALYVSIRHVALQRQAATATAARAERPLLLVLLFSCGAAAMPVLLNLPQRFGAAFYPLLALLLVGGLRNATEPVVRRGVAAILAATLVMPLYLKVIDPTTLAEQRSEWQLARHYIEAIHASQQGMFWS